MNFYITKIINKLIQQKKKRKIINKLVYVIVSGGRAHDSTSKFLICTH